MTEKTVLVEIKQVYGVERLYPINETAKLFAAIEEKSTISHRALGLIKKLGFEVKQKLREINL